MKTIVVQLMIGMVLSSKLVLASVLCDAYYKVDRSESVFRNEFEKVVFNEQTFSYSGLKALPNLVGDYVKIEYSVKNSMDIHRVRGTVIRQHSGTLEVVDSEGKTQTVRSDLSALSVRKFKNPGEPMDFKEIFVGRSGLAMLKGQNSHEGNEIVIDSDGKKTHGYILSPTPEKLLFIHLVSPRRATKFLYLFV